MSSPILKTTKNVLYLKTSNALHILRHTMSIGYDISFQWRKQGNQRLRGLVFGDSASTIKLTSSLCPAPLPPTRWPWGRPTAQGLGLVGLPENGRKGLLVEDLETP